MPIITASSISRQAYSKKISTGSYKESGDTEYTGGILIGWNWHGVTDIGKSVDKADQEKERCSKRGYRKMTFDILKFRNSKRDTRVRLVYYPAYSYFVDEYGWSDALDSENPFDNWDNVKIKGANTGSKGTNIDEFLPDPSDAMYLP